MKRECKPFQNRIKIWNAQFSKTPPQSTCLPCKAPRNMKEEMSECELHQNQSKIKNHRLLKNLINGLPNWQEAGIAVSPSHNMESVVVTVDTQPSLTTKTNEDCNVVDPLESQSIFSEQVLPPTVIEFKEVWLSPDDVLKETPRKRCKDVLKTIDRNFPCKFCHAIFSRQSNRKRHESNCKMNAEKVLPTFSCPHCKKLFRRNQLLSHHVEKCKRKTQPNFQCAHCKSMFHKKFNLRRHLKKCTSEKPLLLTKRTPCLIENCDASFYHRKDLINHFSSAHQNLIAVKPKETKTFPSIEDFNAWKEQMEESTFSYYSARRGRVSKVTQHFYCQRDGSSKLHSERKTSRRRKLPSVKVGHHCTSKIKMTVTDDKTIHVEYYPTHSHPSKQEDQQHHPIPPAMSKFIDEKLAEKMSPAVVYELAKKHFLPQNNSEVHDFRAGNLTRALVYERGRRRRMALRLDKDDAKSVYLLAAQHIQEDDSVLIYKPLGGKVVHGPQDINNLPKSEELFLFAFQTDYQLTLMKRHCSKILIVGETQGTNQYKYKLLTAMVVDENRRGWPVAHLINNRSDADTLQFFFLTLRSRLQCEVSIINCVITDDDAALINAMTAGFSRTLTHILCKWYFIKNLKEQMRIKVSNHLFDEMMSEMKDIMNAKDESIFLMLKNVFKNRFDSNPHASKYMLYLDQHYWNRAEKWAMCYRNFPHANVDTTGHLESFRNRLKTNFLKRISNKRLDDLINLLYDMACNDKRTLCREAKTGFLVQPQQIFERHRKGLSLDDNIIVEQILDNKLWEVKSGSGNGTYFIARTMEYCELDLCFMKCPKAECDSLCAHLFSCSCPDHHPLCEHIHKLQSVLVRNEPLDPSEEGFYNIETAQSPEMCEELSEKNSENVEETLIVDDWKKKVIWEKLESHFALLQDFMAQDLNNVSEHRLLQVEAILSSLIPCLKPEETEVLVSEMERTVKFAPNDQLKTQLSQLAAFRRPLKRQRKENPSSLGAQEQQAIDSLLSYADQSDPLSNVADAFS